MDPPAYEEIASEKGIWDGDAKTTYHINIREEVGASRSQHVAVLVSKLMPQIRERAKHGLSKSTLLILPSDQGMLYSSIRFLILCILIGKRSQSQQERYTSRLLG